MGGLPGALGRCHGAVEAEDVSQMTGWFLDGAGCTRGAPGDNGPCPVNC